MKTSHLTCLSILLALSASVVGAQEGKTRAEVHAERDEAIRKGELLDGTTGQPMHSLYPGMYNPVVKATVSRRPTSD